MNFKKVILIVLGLILLFLTFNMFTVYQRENSVLVFQFEVKSDLLDDYQLFYSTKEDEEWSEENSIHQTYDKPGIWQTIKYVVPKNIYSIRTDLGNHEAIIGVKNVRLIGTSNVDVSLGDAINLKNQLEIIEQQDNNLTIKALDKDPFLTLDIKSLLDTAINSSDITSKVKAALLSLLTTLVCLYIVNSTKDICKYMREIYRGRSIIFNLARNDFKTKYASSYLGIVWGFIQPLLTIVTYWFVFQVGLRSGNVSDVPFILWFIVAIIPWFFFSEALTGATNVYSEYSYLVKKVVFKIELLPVVKIVSALFVHLFFIIFIFAMYIGYGYYPDFYNVQLIYYLLCTIALAFSVSLLTSTFVLFFKDLNQIIIIVLQIGFWFTPIGWPPTMLSNSWVKIFKLNPMFYIVEGYRDTFIRNVPFIDHPYYTIYFWLFCVTAFVIGVNSFKKLKPHFADVI
ncbi:ABC transporter permease [Paenibacillus aceti]|uniref:Transport permease protein n=1 Tax=Paenibacillus aceti TaxID=1820010 RepID=A0ABQ1W0T3_9BACL|nr:ABC transporter permease [Paenibacillus aceti]GGG08218.1 hypothetical protein GCM10010913_32460 [Paenibacillus aceti]